MARDSTSPIAIPVLPGLDDLPNVVSRTIWELSIDPEWELPDGYTKYDLQADLSDPRNWYVAGGHIVPSFEECLRYAKDYVRMAREKA